VPDNSSSAASFAQKLVALLTTPSPAVSH